MGCDNAGGVLNVHAHQLDDAAALQILAQGVTDDMWRA